MAVGWFRLPRSGLLYHGSIPDGVEPIEAPSIEAGQEHVDAIESDTPVSSDDTGVDLTTQTQELRPLPPGAVIRGDEVYDDNADFLGHVTEFAAQDPEA